MIPLQRKSIVVVKFGGNQLQISVFFIETERSPIVASAKQLRKSIQRYSAK
jgi:hypothetical protein